MKGKKSIYNPLLHYYGKIISFVIAGFIFYGLSKWIINTIILNTNDLSIEDLIAGVLIAVFCYPIFIISWNAKRIFTDEKGLYLKRKNQWILVTWNEVSELHKPWWVQLNPVFQARKIKIKNEPKFILFFTNKLGINTFETLRESYFQNQKE